MYRHECTVEGVVKDWSTNDYYDCLLGTLMFPFETNVFFKHVRQLVQTTQATGGREIQRYN